VKNRVLGMSAMAAALMASMASAAKGLTLPPMFGDEAGTNDPRPPRYKKRGGYSAAQVKRAARKRRNVLRARGHHRQAVR
jgi:hypothetical protein